jgi:PPOX class probable F420-dependent enzyme
MSSDGLKQFSNKKYINLETRRKSGQSIRTPVWFVQDRETIYVRTDRKSGKVRRARNNPNVRVVPSDIRGKPKGEWIDGTVKIMDDFESMHAKKLLDQKYGLSGKMLGIMYKIRKVDFVVLSIRFDADKGL